MTGIQIEVKTREDCLRYTTAVDFYQLIFNTELVQMICVCTNNNAHAQFENKPSLESGWTDVTVIEMYTVFGLLFYMTIVRLHNVQLYWSTKTLFMEIKQGFLCQE